MPLIDEAEDDYARPDLTPVPAGWCDRISDVLICSGLIDSQQVNCGHDNRVTTLQRRSIMEAPLAEQRHIAALPPYREDPRYGLVPSYSTELPTISERPTEEALDERRTSVVAGRQARQDSTEPVSPLTKRRTVMFASNPVSARWQPRGDPTAGGSQYWWYQGLGEAAGLFGLGI